MTKTPNRPAANDDAALHVQAAMVWDRETWTLNFTARVDLSDVLRDIEQREGIHEFTGDMQSAAFSIDRPAEHAGPRLCGVAMEVGDCSGD